MTAAQEIISAGKRLYDTGLVVSNDGNISVRLDNGDILATPTGVSKGFMTEDMLVLLGPDGEQKAGTLKPSSEMKMHLAIYRENPEIRAVVHAHPPAATAYASTGLPLDRAVAQETVVQLGVVPVAPYALPGSKELAESCAPYCRKYNAVLLEYHGATTWGRGLTQALHRMESVEYYAKMLITLRLMGVDRPMTRAQVEDLLALRPAWGITGGGVPKCRGDFY